VLDDLGLSGPELALALVAAFAGATVQGLLAFGYALVVVPALLLVAPTAVPIAPLAVALPMVGLLAYRERAGLDRPGFARLTAGRVPGTALGAYVLTLVSADAIAIVVGAILLLAVAVSVAARGVRTTPAAEVAAGFASGVAGTVASLGGPALALAYQDRSGPVLRATISLAFAVGVVVSLAGIAIAGELRAAPVWLGLAMVPSTLAGLEAGRRLAGRVDGRWLRPAILGFAGLGGAIAVLRGLL